MKTPSRYILGVILAAATLLFHVTTAEGRGPSCCKRLSRGVDRIVDAAESNLQHFRDAVKNDTKIFNSWHDFQIFLMQINPIGLGVNAFICNDKSDDHHGIELACFSRGRVRVLRETIDFLANDPNVYPELGGKQPLVYVKHYLKTILWLPPLLRKEDAIAAYPKFLWRNVAFVGREFMELPVYARAATLIHEATHADTPHHGCQGGADEPEIRYLAKVASLGNHPQLNLGSHCNEIDNAFSTAASREIHICGSNTIIGVRQHYPNLCNPLYSDRDGDLWTKYYDNCPDISNSDQLDRDGDTFGDTCDNCPSISNVIDRYPNVRGDEFQSDLDKDGQGDECDEDDDNDTIKDDKDNCYFIANFDQKDFDKDGSGDTCDPDDDHDGVDDNFDNCPFLTNPSPQTDTDQDGIGNACDEDDDNDDSWDFFDNCPLLSNPSQEDADKDRMGDACDLDDDNDGRVDWGDNCPFHSNLLQEDQDRDGKGDICDLDDDNDGISDLEDNCPRKSNLSQEDSDQNGIGDACDPIPPSAPLIVLNPPSGFFNGRTQLSAMIKNTSKQNVSLYYYYGRVSASMAADSVSLPIYLLRNGIIYAYAANPLGVRSAISEASFTFDDTPPPQPEIVISPSLTDQNYYRDAITISIPDKFGEKVIIYYAQDKSLLRLEQIDFSASIPSYVKTYTSPFQVKGETGVISAIAVDQAENKSTLAASQYFRYDGKIPTISMTGHPSGFYTQDQSIRLTADEDVTFLYTLDGKDPIEGDSSVQIVSKRRGEALSIDITQPERKIRYKAKDLAGNETAISRLDYYIAKQPLVTATLNPQMSQFQEGDMVKGIHFKSLVKDIEIYAAIDRHPLGSDRIVLNSTSLEGGLHLNPPLNRSFEFKYRYKLPLINYESPILSEKVVFLAPAKIIAQKETVLYDDVVEGEEIEFSVETGGATIDKMTLEKSDGTIIPVEVPSFYPAKVPFPKETLTTVLKVSLADGRVLQKEFRKAKGIRKWREVAGSSDFVGHIATMTVDLKGNVYFIEYNPKSNGRQYLDIKKIAPDGTLSFVEDLSSKLQCHLSPGQVSSGFTNFDTSQELKGSLLIDQDGNFIIADPACGRVAKINHSTGEVLDLAGTRVFDHYPDAEGKATEVSIRPSKMAWGPDGSIYFTQPYNHRVRQLYFDASDQTWKIRRIAGGGDIYHGTFSGDGGTPKDARLNGPSGITVDSQGNIYVADVENHRIRKIYVDTNGVWKIITIAGTGTFGISPDGEAKKATLALQYTSSLFVNKNDELHIVDTWNHWIRKIYVENNIEKITTAAGGGPPNLQNSGDGKLATEAYLYFPTEGVFTLDGSIYVYDSYLHRIRKINSQRVISTILGKGENLSSEDNIPALQSKLVSLNGALYDKNTDTLFLADQEKIQKIDRGGILSTIHLESRGVYISALVLSSDGKELFYAIWGDPNITGYFVQLKKLDLTTLNVSQIAGHIPGTGGEEEVGAPYALFSFIDALQIDKEKNIYISDDSIIKKYDPLSQKVKEMSPFSSQKYRGITFNGDILYVASYDTVKKLSIKDIVPTFEIVAGSVGKPGFSGDGRDATLAQLFYAIDVAKDETGNLFIVDSANDRIRKISAKDGMISTAIDLRRLHSSLIGATKIFSKGTSLFIITSERRALIESYLEEP